MFIVWLFYTDSRAPKWKQKTLFRKTGIRFTPFTQHLHTQRCAGLLNVSIRRVFILIVWNAKARKITTAKRSYFACHYRSVSTERIKTNFIFNTFEWMKNKKNNNNKQSSQWRKITTAHLTRGTLACVHGAVCPHFIMYLHNHIQQKTREKNTRRI